MKSKEIKRELEELHSKLPDLRDEGIPSVPEGYFENLSGRIIQRLEREKLVQINENVLSLRNTSVAAAFLVLCGFMWWATNNNLSIWKDEGPEIAVEDVSGYFIDYPDELNIQELYNMESPEDFSWVDMDNLDENTIQDFLINNIDYIDENLIDEFK